MLLTALFKDLPKKLILASSSPRRKDLLSLCGFPFEIIPSDFDEDAVVISSPKELVETLSLEKAQTILKKFPEAIIFGADTTVALDQEILGKPKDKDDACQMLYRMQGRDHLVWGGYTILSNQHCITESCVTKVFFNPLSEEEIRAYVDTGEPMDKAGSYGAQGIGSTFIKRIEGSYTNVVGLPLAEFTVSLKSFISNIK